MGRAAKPGRKQISLRLPAAMVDRIDDARGVQGRDDFIARILTSALAGEPRQPRRASSRRRPAVAPADPLPSAGRTGDGASPLADLPRARLTPLGETVLSRAVPMQEFQIEYPHPVLPAVGSPRGGLRFPTPERSAYDKALAELGGPPLDAEPAPDTGASADVVDLARRYVAEHPGVIEAIGDDGPWPGDAAVASGEAELAIVAGAQAADPELMSALLSHLERPVEDPDGPADRLPSPTGGPVAGPAAALEEPVAGLVVPAAQLEAIQTQDAPAMATSSFRSRRTGGITADTVLPPPVHRHKRDSQRVSFVNGRKVIHAKCACGEEWVV